MTEGTIEPEVALTIFAPISGKLLVQMEGGEPVAVADFKYDIPIKIVLPEGSEYKQSKVQGF